MPGVLVLKRMQQGDRTIEVLLDSGRAGGREVDRSHFLFAEFVIMTFIGEGETRSQAEHDYQSRESHSASILWDFEPRKWETFYPEVESKKNRSRGARVSEDVRRTHIVPLPHQRGHLRSALRVLESRKHTIVAFS